MSVHHRALNTSWNPQDQHCGFRNCGFQNCGFQNCGLQSQNKNIQCSFDSPALKRVCGSCCHAHTAVALLNTAGAALQDPRLLSYALRLRYSDFNKVDKIINDINAFLESHSGVDHKLAHRARLTDLATYSVDISITVSTACRQVTQTHFEGVNKEEPCCCQGLVGQSYAPPYKHRNGTVLLHCALCDAIA